MKNILQFTDDPLTDEEQEIIKIKEKRSSINELTSPKVEAAETKSLALGSCYSSLTDLGSAGASTATTKVKSDQEAKNSTSEVADTRSPPPASEELGNNTRQSTTQTLTQKSIIEAGQDGWRLAK